VYLLDVLEEDRCLSTGELRLRRACQDRLALALRELATYWKQCGKHRAIREGDANTQFFHAQASQRLRRNNIRLLEVCGIAVSSHQDKTAVLTDHLRGLLDANGPTTGRLDLAALYSGSTTVDAAPLITPFTEPEA
jgi:hypothetical protein